MDNFIFEPFLSTCKACLQEIYPDYVPFIGSAQARSEHVEIYLQALIGKMHCQLCHEATGIAYDFYERVLEPKDTDT